jgi:hypothetical protein
LSGAAPLAIDPQNGDTVYAVTGDGILHKSTDGGASWPQVLAPCCVLSFLVFDSQDSNTVYTGPYRSTDGGATWEKLGLTQAQFPTTIVADPQNSGTLYVLINPDDGLPPVFSIRARILKSVDKGITWTETYSGWPGFYVTALKFDPRDSAVMYAQTTWQDCGWVNCYGVDYYDPNSEQALNGLGLFRSADRGMTWAKLNPPGDPGQSSLLAIDFLGTLYAQTTAGLVRSMDGGTNWNALATTGLTSSVNTLAFDPQNPNHLYAGTSNAGVFEITIAP